MTDLHRNAMVALDIIRSSQGPLPLPELRRCMAPAARRTVNHAVKALLEHGLVRKTTALSDTRRAFYIAQEVAS